MSFTLLDLEQIIAGLRRRLRLLEIQGNSGVIKTGIAADRPAIPTFSTATTTSYYATDTKVLSVWNIQTETWNTITFS